MNPYRKNNKVDISSLLGGYESCYVGYVNTPEFREKSSSGGILTWLLTELLTSKSIDGVITVVEAEPGNDKLFKFDILRSVEELQRAAGSKYYPVEISNILQWLRSDKSNDCYAIVGLPCLLQGIENACNVYRRLDRKLKYRFSLTCGQLPNRFYTEALAVASSVSIEKLNLVRYREKRGTTIASDFIFQAYDKDGNAGVPTYWLSRPSYLWENSFFIHAACKFCDDVFGRASDVIFMDAWLPQYASDPRGHSLIIVKDKELDLFVKASRDSNACHLSEISIDEVLASQSDQILKKTDILAAHLVMAEKKGIRIAPRAIKPNMDSYARWRDIIGLQWETMQRSKRIWMDLRSQGREGEFFKKISMLNNKISILKARRYLRQGFAKLWTSPVVTVERICKSQLQKFIKLLT